MPRTEAVSASRVQPAQQARRVAEARARAISINQRSEQARKEATVRAVEELKQRPVKGVGANLDVVG